MTPKPKTSFAAFHPDSNLTSLPGLDLIQPPAPPTFPSFIDLVRMETNGASTPPTKKGLFEVLVGQAEPLYQATLEHPDKFSEEAKRLLHELMVGTKTLKGLTPAERQVLDLATIDFASHSHRASNVKPPMTPRTPPKRAPVDAAPEGPVQGVDVPPGEQEAYWWLK